MTVNGAIPTLDSIDTPRMADLESGDRMADIHLTDLNGRDIARRKMTGAKIIEAVEQAPEPVSA
ncbi:hypothetical protein MNJPNG_07120 [Cupriavidus oxalaticus]